MTTLTATARIDMTRRNASRRQFLTYSAGCAAMAATNRVVAAIQEKHLQVAKVDRMTVNLPFRPIPDRNMSRELPHWRYAELCRVRLRAGVEGVGETLLYYTWRATSDQDVERCIGRNAAECMWDDSFGAGLQMAMMDAVARAAEVPLHRLLGKQVHSKTPLSWWNIDTSPEDMALECQEALRLGYNAYKSKGRPWYDVWEQVRQAAAVTPENFQIDMDFNDTLLDADRGIPILQDLEKHPQVSIYETPIPQSDIQGNHRIREATRVGIALHFGTPSPTDVVRHGVCDGFVVGGGASSVMSAGRFCDQVEMPFWLQLVGSGVTAAYSLHFGAVLQQARWPAVNCHQLYEHNLLMQDILVKDGMADVPDGPGLGYEVNWEMVDDLRVQKPSQRPDPPRLIESRWPSGETVYFANNGKVNFVLTAAQRGETPYFERGVTTQLLPNDGTPRWKELYEKARQATLRVRS